MLEVATICVKTGLNPARHILESSCQYVWCHCLNFFGGFTCRHTLILKTPVFGKVKIPRRCMKNPPHSEKICVWCGMSRRRIIGPNFFDATITTAAYMEIFNSFVNQLDDEELSIGYFQQNGAKSYTSHRTERHPTLHTELSDIPHFTQN